MVWRHQSVPGLALNPAAMATGYARPPFENKHRRLFVVVVPPASAHHRQSKPEPAIEPASLQPLVFRSHCR